MAFKEDQPSGASLPGGNDPPGDGAPPPGDGAPPPGDGAAAPARSDATGPPLPQSSQAERHEPRRVRYSIVERDGARHIICHNAPNLHLHVERGRLVDESKRRRFAPQTIFLDGVYTEAPFFDNEARHYSLDHHAGCVRVFTLATCEQAMVMLLEGLPLTEGEWQLYVNEPDLDAVLAAWLLFNHADLMRDDRELAYHVMPYVRVEGVIDAHGLDKGVLSGLPRELYEWHKERLDEVLEAERMLKATSSWTDADFVVYTIELLHRLDKLLYPASYLDSLVEVEELARADLRGGKLALLCRSQQGIYAVEAQLKKRYDQLGLLVLDSGNGRYTLRQVDPFMRQDLGQLYRALNRKDPRVGADDAQHNGWGGSGDIGGSPRATGSGLSGHQIMRIVERVYREPGWLGRLFGHR